MSSALKIDRIVITIDDKNFMVTDRNRFQLEIGQIVEALKDLPQAQCVSRTISVHGEDSIFSQSKTKVTIDFERDEKGEDVNVLCPRVGAQVPHKMHEWSYTDEFQEEHHVFCAGYAEKKDIDANRTPEVPDHLKRFARYINGEENSGNYGPNGI